MSLSEKLASFANLAPVFDDPEDDDDKETSAKLTDFNEQVDGDLETKSVLRLRNSILLDADDERYSGKTVSRQKLGIDSSYKDYSLSENDTDEDTDDDEDDEELSEFQSKIRKIPVATSNNTTVEVPSSEAEADSDSYDEHTENSDEDATGEGNDKSSSDTETIQTFSKVNIDDDAEKGSAIKTQLKIWDNVLECRIRLHKSLVASNQLPQFDVWPSFVEEGGELFAKMASDCQQSASNLLDSMIELQTLLLEQNPETNQLGEKAGSSKALKISSDEEIPSDSDMEQDETPVKCSRSRGKHKLKTYDYPELVKKRHTDFESFRNSAIQTWYDRTRVTTGKVKKSFDNFEHSALKRIEQILCDQSRLIERTQLKRNYYKTLGKLPVVKLKSKEIDDDELIKDKVLKHDSHLKDYDKEIFDDNDFYHNLLRELIEHKAIDPHSPNLIVRQWLDLQKFRKKMNKNVDVKASKGRRIRYDVHSKLVNFMAKMDDCTIKEEPRKELFKTLFGKKVKFDVLAEDIQLFKSQKATVPSGV